MDDKFTPSNSGGAVERGPQSTPESLSSDETKNGMPPVETAPVPGSSPVNQSAAVTPPQPTLTADAVAAAIQSSADDPVSTDGAQVPAVAADVDVIEPEWVNKAESEIVAHNGDPYGEEEAVENLQTEYLDKRYGYKVSNPNSDRNKPEGT